MIQYLDQVALQAGSYHLVVLMQDGETEVLDVVTGSCYKKKTTDNSVTVF